MTTINLSIPFESLTQAIQSLGWEEQQKLLEILEKQNLDSEEAWKIVQKFWQKLKKQDKPINQEIIKH